MAAPAQIQPQVKPDDPVEALGDGLRKLVQTEIRDDVDPEKVFQLSDIRKNDFYWKGIQFLKRQVNNGIAEWQPVASQNNAKTTDQPEDLYEYVINDIRGYGRKFIGVIAQEAPNVRALPNKKTSEEHIRRARKAQSVVEILRGLWDIKKICRDVALGFWKSGTQFLYTPFVADSEKYGTSEEQVLADQNVPLSDPSLNCIHCGQNTPIPDGEIPPRACPGPLCGQEFGPEDFVEPETVAFPMPTGETTKYANGCAEAHLYSGIYVTTPFSIRKLADTPFLKLEYEEYKGKILSAYKGKKDIYKKLREMADSTSSSGNVGGYADQLARTTRDQAQSPSGTLILPHKNKWLFSRIWLRPSLFETAKGEVTWQGQNRLLREVLSEQYPNGLKVTMVQDKVIELEPEVLDHVWRMAQPEPAENAYPDPLCKDMMSGQDLTNHTGNIMAETLERQIPQTGIDVDQIDLKARQKYQLPAGFIPLRRKGGGRLEDAVARMAVAKFEPEMESYPNAVRDHSAENVGITRAIFGAGEREHTAYATNLKRNQAMLQLGPALDSLRELIAGALQNGAMQMALHSGGKIPSPYAPKTEIEQMDGLEELAEGGWHVEPNDSQPMSWSERRASLMEFMEKNPMATGAAGFTEIDNIPVLAETLIGLPDWKWPKMDDLAKVNEEIQELLKGSPVPKMGQMGQMLTLPSIPIDDFADDHEFVAAAIKRWCQCDAGRTEKRTNPNGYANVCAFGKAHAGLALPPPGMAPAPTGGPPQASGGAPKPASPAPTDTSPKKLTPPPGGTSAAPQQHATA